MNGGAWLTADGMAVDLLLRGLDAIERWTRKARDGRFEILAQNGYVAGAPTYLPAGELALCRVLHGELPRPAFTDALAAAARERWEGKARVSLMFAGLHAEGADAVACVGMLAHATLCTAHARLAARREWVLNEKRLVVRAGLGEVQRLLAGPVEPPRAVVESCRRARIGAAGCAVVRPRAARWWCCGAWSGRHSGAPVASACSVSSATAVRVRCVVSAARGEGVGVTR